MDELFQLPPCPVAMPRAYWLYNENPPKKILSSQLMLIQPDDIEFERIVQKMNSIGPNDYDMEIVNSLYLDSALILPHRKYDMLTAEFRNKDHTAYLGSEREKWNSTAVLDEAKFVHFSDWPVPKPWIHDPEVRTQNQPDCPDGEISCPDRDIWNGFYTDFADNKEVRTGCCEDVMFDLLTVLCRESVNLWANLENGLTGKKGRILVFGGVFGYRICCDSLIVAHINLRLRRTGLRVMGCCILEGFVYGSLRLIILFPTAVVNTTCHCAIGISSN